MPHPAARRYPVDLRAAANAVKLGYVRVSSWRRPGTPKGHKRIAGAQKPRMAKFQHILVPSIPAIHLCPLGMP
ncbi:hypothetical protein MKFW12EY_42170 [Methylomonas koyamae]|nr:hypothetical protein MKFW12EY_42170 [Methylomonas koyamae]